MYQWIIGVMERWIVGVKEKSTENNLTSITLSLCSKINLKLVVSDPVPNAFGTGESNHLKSEI
ncbi:MAG: hypothetical protein KKF20_04740 [Bacteroidetes bacterium]|nr:hypothetical protein [Bacteroidota bacterium]MBU1423707.1 hypothetical protein [Bacteroidota bacterium]MBU2471694.1 hypothetical protein [Bacteroidota bacterium]